MFLQRVLLTKPLLRPYKIFGGYNNQINYIGMRVFSKDNKEKDHDDIAWSQVGHADPEELKDHEKRV